MQRVYKENEWGKVSKRIVTDTLEDGSMRDRHGVGEIRFWLVG